MSQSSYVSKSHGYFVVAYSYTQGGKTIEHTRVSYEKDEMAALLESYNSLLVRAEPDFQMRIVRKVTFN